MRRFMFIMILAVALGFSTAANATLWDRGGGLIYDDVLNITWLQDTNYAQTSGYDSDGLMNWDKAMTWADSLVYEGYDDWRLPTTLGTTTGYTNEGELGYMFYNNLAGSNGSFPGADFIDGNGKSTSFSKLDLWFYWSETTITIWWYPYDERGWAYHFGNGTQSYYTKNNDFYAWAVRDGDVSAVPETATMLLLGFGLTGLLGFRRKFRRE